MVENKWVSLKGEAMIYSEVVEKGYILPRKEKYTVRDATRIIIDSLFDAKKYGRTLTVSEAYFICRCSAVFYGTEYSKTIANGSDYTGVSRYC